MLKRINSSDRRENGSRWKHGNIGRNEEQKEKWMCGQFYMSTD